MMLEVVPENPTVVSSSGRSSSSLNEQEADKINQELSYKTTLAVAYLLCFYEDPSN